MLNLKIDFVIPQATVASVSRELAQLTFSLGNKCFPAESSGVHYHLRPPSHIEAQWRNLLASNRYLSMHVLWLNAVAHDTEHNRIEGEVREKVVDFRIREKNPNLIQVSAECRSSAIADGFSALLRGLGRFGTKTTEEQLLGPGFQRRLGEVTSEDEKREWEVLGLALCGGQAEPPESEDLVGGKASAHTISQEAELQEIGPSETAPEYVFRKSGNVWEIKYGDCEFHLEDLKGLGLIHALMYRPNHPFSPAELETAVEGTAVESLGRDDREELNGVSDGGINQPVLDEQTIEQVERAIQGLRDELLTAEQEGKEVREKELEDKIEKYEDYLRTSTGKGGKPRNFPDDFGRARVRVTQNIGTAAKAIREQCPLLAEYLDNYIETGNRFVYKLQLPENPWSL